MTLADENGHSNIVEGCEVAAKRKVLFDKEQTYGQRSRLFSVFFEPLTPI